VCAYSKLYTRVFIKGLAKSCAIGKYFFLYEKSKLLRIHQFVRQTSFYVGKKKKVFTIGIFFSKFLKNSDSYRCLYEKNSSAQNRVKMMGNRFLFKNKASKIS